MEEIKFTSIEINRIKKVFTGRLKNLIEDFNNNIDAFVNRKKDNILIKEIHSFIQDLSYTSDFYGFNDIKKLSGLLNSVFYPVYKRKIDINDEIIEIIKTVTEHILQVAENEDKQIPDSVFEKFQSNINEVINFSKRTKTSQIKPADILEVTSRDLENINHNLSGIYTAGSETISILRDNLWKWQKRTGWYSNLNKKLEELTDNLITIQQNYHKIKLKNFSENLEDIIIENRKYGLTQQKRVKFEIADSSVKIEKSNLNILKLILTELIKNSIEHSFIKTEDSKLLDDNFKIKIELKQNGQYIHVIYSENGTGFNKDKILKKAKNRKLIKDINDRESGESVFNFLLMGRPFSTSSNKGKGIGLKKVNKLVKEIDGEINLNIKTYNGRRIELKFPEFKKFV